MRAEATLFDFAAARRRRDQAIAQVEGNSAPDWREAAFRVLRDYARRHYSVFCDEVADEISRRLPGVTTHDLRALGPLFLRAAREQVIARTDTYRPSKRSNGSAKPVWRSLIYQGDAA